jgi:hypothetical protein
VENIGTLLIRLILVVLILVALRTKLKGFLKGFKEGLNSSSQPVQIPQPMATASHSMHTLVGAIGVSERLPQTDAPNNASQSPSTFTESLIVEGDSIPAKASESLVEGEAVNVATDTVQNFRWGRIGVIAVVIGCLVLVLIIGGIRQAIENHVTAGLPRFPDGAIFSDGLAPVSVDDKYGYIDRTGRFVISPQYVNAGTFSDGVAWVVIQDDSSQQRFKYGIINTSGAVTPASQLPVHSPTELPKPFSEGLAAFVHHTPTKYWDMAGNEHNERTDIGYVNRAGSIVIKPCWSRACPFSSNRAAVGECSGWLDIDLLDEAIIDRKGEIVMQGSFRAKGCYSEGIQYLGNAIPSHEGPSRGVFVDTKGNLLFSLDPNATFVGQFSEGLVAQMLGHDQCSYLTRKGDVAIPSFPCKWITSFHEGLARVGLDNGNIGYINKVGQWAIAPTFRNAGDFSEGLALVERAGNQEFIDKTGKTILTPSMIKPKEGTKGTPQPFSVPSSVKIPNLGIIKAAVDRDLAVSVVEDPDLKPQFERLLGSSWAEFEDRLSVSDPVVQRGDWITGQGVQSKSWSGNSAVYAVNARTGDIYVVITVDDVVRVFGVDSPTELPFPLVEWLEH